MGHHPLEHIGRLLLPVEAGIGVVERIEHGVDNARLPPGQHAFAHQRLEPLHHDGADHLDRRGGADWAFVDLRRHAERRESRRRGLDVRAANQEGRPVQARMNRRHHGDVDIASARGFHLPSRARLGLRRAGIAIEEQRSSRETWQRRHRRFVRLVGGDDREHRLRSGDRLGRARSAKHFRRRIVGALRRPNLRVRRIGLDVEGANAPLEIRIGSPAVEEGARRLAKAEKGDGARVYR